MTACCKPLSFCAGSEFKKNTFNRLVSVRSTFQRLRTVKTELTGDKRRVFVFFYNVVKPFSFLNAAQTGTHL